jgi:hypothetical protein
MAAVHGVPCVWEAVDGDDSTAATAVGRGPRARRGGKIAREGGGIDLLGETVFTDFAALHSGLLMTQRGRHCPCHPVPAQARLAGECSLNCGGTCPACKAVAAGKQKGERPLVQTRR